MIQVYSTCTQERVRLAPYATEDAAEVTGGICNLGSNPRIVLRRYSGDQIPDRVLQGSRCFPAFLELGVRGQGPDNILKAVFIPC